MIFRDLKANDFNKLDWDISEFNGFTLSLEDKCVYVPPKLHKLFMDIYFKGMEDAKRDHRTTEGRLPSEIIAEGDCICVGTNFEHDNECLISRVIDFLDDQARKGVFK